MSDLAIRVENLSKLYHIGKAQKRHDTLRDAIVGAFKRSNVPTSKRSNGDDTIWALKDVSFEVKRGEVVGIIGRNGAGKSTLLKILSRITEPTQGRAIINGRVGSLLEVGTGFHPELTGRENIYLNGAVLGMKRVEIDRKFDEIVAFAEIEKFMDTPVKRYSSGMYVRLAFAVAAHLEPEILLVDEVLAVGDYVFQKKCLGKMGEVAKGGRTVLFVSHQLAMINSLCDRVLLLSDGRLVDRGPAAQLIDRYIRSFSDNDNASATAIFPQNPTHGAQLLESSIRGRDGYPAARYEVFDPIELFINYIIREPIEGVAVNLVLKRNGDVLLVSFDTDDEPALLDTRNPGVYTACVQLPPLLKAGYYTIDLSLGRLNVGGVDVRRNALVFEIEERSFDTSKRSYSSGRPGVIAAHLHWRTRIHEGMPQEAS